VKIAIREWAFNLFMRRITIKVAKLPDNEKIEFLTNKLMNELISQGYDIKGSPNGHPEYFTIFGFDSGKGQIDSHHFKLSFKRLTSI